MIPHSINQSVAQKVSLRHAELTKFFAIFDLA